jgi:chromosome segregation ATPase
MKEKQGRDAHGRFLPTTSPLEAEIATLKADLAETQRLYNLSKMSDANARGILQQIRTELGGNPDEPALTKVQKLLRERIERGVACEHNAAEVVRLAESLRLAEQGRDEALRGREAGLEQIKKLRDDLTLAQRTSEGYKANLEEMKSEAGRLRIKLDYANADKEQLESFYDQSRGDVHRAIFEGTLQTIVASVLVAVAAFLVGRWAR